MYENTKSRWFKHFNFMLLDLLVIELAYLSEKAIKKRKPSSYVADYHREADVQHNKK